VRDRVILNLVIDSQFYSMDWLGSFKKVLWRQKCLQKRAVVIADSQHGVLWLSLHLNYSGVKLWSVIWSLVI